MTSIINDWTNVLSPERNEIVFENRNQSYGAYVIRRDYSRSLIIALFSTATAILLLALIPKWLGLYNTADVFKRVIEGPQIIEITLPPNTPIEIPQTHPAETVSQPELKQDVTAPPVVVDETTTEKPIPAQDIQTPPQSSTLPSIGGDNPGDVGSNSFGSPDLPETPIEIPDVMPSFPGGEKAMYAYLSNNIRFPETLRQRGMMGKVFITFVVNRNGKIISVKERKGIEGGKDFTTESIRVISGMPEWIPGKQGGKPVAVVLTLPVSFNLH